MKHTKSMNESLYLQAEPIIRHWTHHRGCMKDLQLTATNIASGTVDRTVGPDIYSLCSHQAAYFDHPPSF
jgi:hypothetical protein